MYKSLKLKAALGGVLCCAQAAQAAGAQNSANSQLLSSGLKETFSAADVSAMMAEFDIQTALEPYEGDETATLAAATDGGAKFWISLFQCDDPTTGGNCRGAALFTGLSNAGVSYDDINSFHSQANVTRAVNLSEQNIIIFGTQIFFSGGVGRDNFKYVTALFLTDMQRYVDGKTESGTLVSLDIAPSDRSKVGNVTQAADEAPPDASAIRFDVEHALSAAIANTWRVSFEPKTD